MSRSESRRKSKSKAKTRAKPKAKSPKLSASEVAYRERVGWSKVPPKVVPVAAPVVTQVVARARRSTKTARRSPLERTKHVKGPHNFRPLPLDEDKRQHLEPRELIDFFQQIPAATLTSSLLAKPSPGSIATAKLSLVHAPLPPPTATYWHTYFFLLFFYGLKVSEPALIKEADIRLPKAGAKGGKIRLRRLKKGRDPIDGDAQREARAKAAAKGVKRFKKRDDFTGGFDEYTYDMPECVLNVIQKMHAWKASARKKDAENPFFFSSMRHRKNAVVGIERQSQLRNIDGWQAVSRFTVNRLYSQLATNAKWPEHLRECRSVPALKHTRAVFMLAAGVPIEEVRFLLGHTPKMTERYLPVAQALRDKFGAETFAMFGKDTVVL